MPILFLLATALLGDPIAEIEARAAAYDGAPLSVHGFYPGMPRGEAFDAATAVGFDLAQDRAGRTGLFAADPRGEEVRRLTVEFADAREADAPWDAEGQRAVSVRIEAAPLSGERVVVADEMAALIARYGEPAASTVGTGEGTARFTLDLPPAADPVAVCSAATYLPSRQSMVLRSGVNPAAPEMIAETCPDALEAWVEAKAQSLAPVMTVTMAHGRPEVAYTLTYQAAKRFSAQGKRLCAERGMC